MSKTNKFDQAVDQMRTAIMRRIKDGRVSSVDVADVSVGIRGARRGAVVSTAFNRLVEEKRLRRTSATVYNSSTKNSVAVYSKVGR